MNPKPPIKAPPVVRAMPSRQPMPELPGSWPVVDGPHLHRLPPPPDPDPASLSLADWCEVYRGPMLFAAKAFAVVAVLIALGMTVWQTWDLRASDPAPTSREVAREAPAKSNETLAAEFFRDNTTMRRLPTSIVVSSREAGAETFLCDGRFRVRVERGWTGPKCSIVDTWLE